MGKKRAPEEHENDENEHKKKKKKKKKKRMHDDERTEEAESVGVAEEDTFCRELEEVDFTLPGSYNFTTCVKLSAAFNDLNSFKRYIDQQHVAERMQSSNYTIHLQVEKKKDDCTRILEADSVSEWCSFKTKIIHQPEKYSLKVRVKTCSLVSKAAALLVVEQAKRKRQRANAAEAHEDEAYEKKLRDYLSKSCMEKPSRNTRQEARYQQFCNAVTSKFPGAEPISDIEIRCGRCGTNWRLNRRWYYQHFETNHLKSSKCSIVSSSTGAKQITLA
eukprot:GHVR01099531.1.p1 GENE.GHVR01099531.1~~GHVR01099531.1.p1  ORF type:complete len:275 (+),score=36.12 GHVR01099531.1:46-870(+)